MSVPIIDEEILSAAQNILDNVISGQCQVSDFTCQLAIPKGEAAILFNRYLDECENIYGIQPCDFLLEEVGLECSEARLKRILKKEELPKIEELLAWLFKMDENGQYNIYFYCFIPIKSTKDNQPYVIIVEEGIPLDPEYSIIGVFNTKADADHYFNNNYDY